MRYRESSLTAFFDDFYKEVIVCKKLALATKEADVDSVCNNIFNKLSNYIQNNSSFYVQDLGEFIESNLTEVIYLMVSLADEIFLNYSWGGQDLWAQNLLEWKFFNTHKSGEEVFKRIDEFLLNRSPLLTEMASIYLKTLALGFKGKYRTSNPSMLGEYRKKLYQFITQGDADINSEKVFLQGYNSTLSALPAQFFPSHNTWDYVFYLFVVFFITGTSIFWELEIGQIKNLMLSINGGINA